MKNTNVDVITLTKANEIKYDMKNMCNMNNKKKWMICVI